MERTEKIHATHKYSFCYIPAFLQVSLAPFVPEINRVLYHTESIQSSDPMRALISAWMTSPGQNIPSFSRQHTITTTQ
jgi:hypothetical protein